MKTIRIKAILLIAIQLTFIGWAEAKIVSAIPAWSSRFSAVDYLGEVPVKCHILDVSRKNSDVARSKKCNIAKVGKKPACNYKIIH
jgi:hypothetical protein